MKKPIIGVMGNTYVMPNTMFNNCQRHYANTAYIEAVERNGGIPVLIPYSQDTESVNRLIDMCDGLLFPGGEDVDPRQYGENPHFKLGEIKPDMDNFLISAVKYAVSINKPLLGICKGMQILNVATGGSLYQDIHSQLEGETFLHMQHANKYYEVHSVNIDANSNLYKVFGEEKIYTNSLHHQSVKTTGEILNVVARADDGVVEAIESNDGTIIGVQWHPEEMSYRYEKMNLLFKDLVARAQKCN